MTSGGRRPNKQEGRHESVSLFLNEFSRKVLEKVTNRSQYIDGLLEAAGKEIDPGPSSPAVWKLSEELDRIQKQIQAATSKGNFRKVSALSQMMFDIQRAMQPYLELADPAGSLKRYCVVCAKPLRRIFPYRLKERARFCSVECANLGKRTGKFVKCKQCKNRKYVHDARLKTFKFCSADCWYTYHKNHPFSEAKKRRIANNVAKALTRGLWLQCARRGCGNDFYRPLSHVAGSKYCSKKCADEAKVGRPPSEETRSKVSIETKKYFDEHPETKLRLSRRRKQYLSKHPRLKRKLTNQLRASWTNYMDNHPEALTRAKRDPSTGRFMPKSQKLAA